MVFLVECVYGVYVYIFSFEIEFALRQEKRRVCVWIYFDSSDCSRLSNGGKMKTEHEFDWDNHPFNANNDFHFFANYVVWCRLFAAHGANPSLFRLWMLLIKNTPGAMNKSDLNTAFLFTWRIECDSR